MDKQIRLRSSLPSRFKPELEQLVFFNPQQHRVADGIVDSIERFGAPEIVAEDDTVCIRLAQGPDVQTLFATEQYGRDERLAGVMIYTRATPDTLVLIHIGVRTEYAAGGPMSGELLTLRLLSELRRVARRLSGVRSIEMIYGRGVKRTMRV